MEKKTFLVAYKNVAFYHFTLFLVICYAFIKYKSLLLLFPARQAAFLCLMCLGGKTENEMENTPCFVLFIGKEGKLNFMERGKLNGFLMLTG